MTEELYRYYRTLRKCLLCSKAVKDRMVGQAERKVKDFLNEKPHATYEDIENVLGDPKTLAETFMETLDAAEIHRGKRTRHILRIALVAVPVVFALICAYLYYITQMQADMEIITGITTTVIYN
jgi:hypothetical protein